MRQGFMQSEGLVLLAVSFLVLRPQHGHVTAIDEVLPSQMHRLFGHTSKSAGGCMSAGSTTGSAS